MGEYINNGKPTKRYFAQIQLQMHFGGYFCVAHPDPETPKEVEIIF